MVRGDGDCDGGVDARQFLDGDRVGQRVAPSAAVLLRDRHPHQPELAELCDEVVREPRLAVELLGHRRDTLLREVADGRADELLLLAVVEVQALSCRASSTISRTPYPVPPRCVR